MHHSGLYESGGHRAAYRRRAAGHTDGQYGWAASIRKRFHVGFSLVGRIVLVGSGAFGGIVFLALSLLFEAIGRIENNVYSLTTAYFRQNPSEAMPFKPLGTSRSSLTKMTNYKMGKTEE
jgi:hypothetical protein